MRNGTFWAGLLTGAVLGAAIALVFAPKAGHETRGDVVEGVRKFKEAAAERGRHALRRHRGKLEEIAEEISEQA